MVDIDRDPAITGESSEEQRCSLLMAPLTRTERVSPSQLKEEAYSPSSETQAGWYRGVWIDPHARPGTFTHA